MLKGNGYQESIMFKTFRKITNNHSSSFSQQQTPTTNIQEERIRMNINLAYVEGTGEKLWHILISHKIRSTFNFESTLCKLLCKLKDWAATEDKANMVFKWSLKLLSDEPKTMSRIAIVKRMKLQNTVGKQIAALAVIRKKLLIGKAG